MPRSVDTIAQHCRRALALIESDVHPQWERLQYALKSLETVAAELGDAEASNLFQSSTAIETLSSSELDALEQTLITICRRFASA